MFGLTQFTLFSIRHLHARSFQDVHGHGTRRPPTDVDYCKLLGFSFLLRSDGKYRCGIFFTPLSLMSLVLQPASSFLFSSRTCTILWSKYWPQLINTRCAVDVPGIEGHVPGILPGPSCRSLLPFPGYLCACVLIYMYLYTHISYFLPLRLLIYESNWRAHRIRYPTLAGVSAPNSRLSTGDSSSTRHGSD